MTSARKSRCKHVSKGFRERVIQREREREKGMERGRGEKRRREGVREIRRTERASSLGKGNRTV
jgi:hypothetical protein